MITNNSSHNFSNQKKFVKKVELPENRNGGRTHRVTCLTTRGEELWGGCQSGLIFSYCGQEDEERRGKEELILSHPTQLLLGEGEEVNAMVGGKEGLMWVGGENGWLSVWKRSYGPVVGEELKYSSPLLEDRYFFQLPKMLIGDLFFKLEYGQVKWKELDGEGSLLMNQVKEVRGVAGNRGGVGVVLVEEDGGRERRFELGGNDGKKGVDCLKFALFCMKRKRILERVGELKLNRKLMALNIVGGRVWSFDGSLMVCFLLLILQMNALD